MGLPPRPSSIVNGTVERESADDDVEERAVGDTRCHSPLYIREVTVLGSTDSGGRSSEMPRRGFCLRPCWK